MKAIKFASMFLLVALMSFSYSAKAQSAPSVYNSFVTIEGGVSPETVSFAVTYNGEWTVPGYPVPNYPTLIVVFQVVYKDRGDPIPKTMNVTVYNMNYQAAVSYPTATYYSGSQIEPFGFGNHSIVSWSVVSSETAQ